MKSGYLFPYRTRFIGLLLILSLIFTNGVNFIDILRLNLWIPLVFFIIRFRWVIFRLNRSLN